MRWDWGERSRVTFTSEEGNVYSVFPLRGAAGLRYLQAVAVDEHLQHHNAAHVHVLDLFRGDVLALGQLEDVLFPVDDPERPVLPNGDRGQVQIRGAHGPSIKTLLIPMGG
jgi:hypothetical protein